MFEYHDLCDDRGKKVVEIVFYNVNDERPQAKPESASSASFV